jgi:hypothetical protein
VSFKVSNLENEIMPRSRIPVSPKHFLVNARCVRGKSKTSKSEFRFYRDDDHDDDEVDYWRFGVSEYFIHPDWNPEDEQYAADIAIVELQRNIRLSKKIRHVCLNTPSEPIQSFAERKASLYGWGLTKDLGFVKELRHVEVPLVDQAMCNSSSLISDTSFCVGARDGKADPCKGNLACF